MKKKERTQNESTAENSITLSYSKALEMLISKYDYK